ncbi:hypothetical protein BDZ89DRAFT_1066389 [Hymenopellis radicata]|nr:hypothetical protein BDZ89DRAFT_1066389 [Hymenopellis radicata]
MAKVNVSSNSEGSGGVARQSEYSRNLDRDVLSDSAQSKKRKDAEVTPMTSL